MKFYQKFKSLSKKKQITITVWLVHISAVCFLAGQYSFSRRLQPMKKISVRTVIPQVADKPSFISKSTDLKKSSGGERKGSNTAKKVLANTPVVSQKKKEGGSKIKNEQRKKENVILKEISNSLDVIKTSSVQKNKSEEKCLPIIPSIPVKENQTESCQKSSLTHVRYGEFLIGYFQETLDLPEYGDVKVKIEIDKFGKLTFYEILEAKSLKNAEFLKNALPELTFPCLNDFDILETVQTFTITFRNVETR